MNHCGITSEGESESWKHSFLCFNYEHERNTGWPWLLLCSLCAQQKQGKCGTTKIENAKFEKKNLNIGSFSSLNQFKLK